MNEGLQELLWLAGGGMVIGLAIAAVIVWRLPELHKQLAQSCANLRWGWYGLFGLMFVAFALASWWRPYYAIFFGLFALLEFAVMISKLIRQRSPLASKV